MAKDTPNPKDQSSGKESHPRYSEVDIDVQDEEVVHSIAHGVMSDKINYRRLAFWTILGIVLFVVFVYSLVNMFDYNKFRTSERLSAQTEFTEINKLQENDRKQLNSFGVVDEENNVYRVPIDSAINYLARQR